MKKTLIFFLVLIENASAYGWYFYSPLQDNLLLPSFDSEKKSIFAIGAASIRSAHAYGNSGPHTDPLRLWNNSESTISMLNGFTGTSSVGQLAQEVNATDDGVRGHIRLTGDYQITWGLLFGGYIPIKHGWSFVWTLPSYHAQLDIITVEDRTLLNSVEDYRVQQLLTKNLSSVLSTYGSGLSIESWSKTGIGDLSLCVQWQRDFAQHKPMLNNVSLGARAGFQIPTSQRVSLDKLLSHSFGNQGAWALPIGGQLTLYLGNYFLMGLDVELTYILNHTVTQRLKTAKEQSEHFLLWKREVPIDFGMNQRFTLFAEGHNNKYGFKTILGYQYFKHGDDTLCTSSTNIDHRIINSAQSLESSTAHHALIKTEWNISKSITLSHIEPVISLFAKVPFNGKNTILNTFFGGSLNINF